FTNFLNQGGKPRRFDFPQRLLRILGRLPWQSPKQFPDRLLQNCDSLAVHVKECPPLDLPEGQIDVRQKVGAAILRATDRAGLPAIVRTFEVVEIIHGNLLLAPLPSSARGFGWCFLPAVDLSGSFPASG